MKMAVFYLESQGFRVLDSGTFLKEWIPRPGVLTRRLPESEERADVEYGIPLARQLAHWGVGQTLVIRRKAVVAVEASTGLLCGLCLSSLVRPDSGHITQLCIVPQRRGRGIGLELMRRAIGAFRTHGCTAVSLAVTASFLA